MKSNKVYYYISAVGIGLFIGLFLWIRMTKNKDDAARMIIYEKKAAYHTLRTEAGIGTVNVKGFKTKSIKKIYECQGCYEGKDMRLCLLNDGFVGQPHYQIHVMVNDQYHLYSEGLCGLSKSDSTMLMLKATPTLRHAKYRFSKMPCHGEFVNPTAIDANKYIIKHAADFPNKGQIFERWLIKKTTDGWLDTKSKNRFKFNPELSKQDDLEDDFVVSETFPETYLESCYENGAKLFVQRKANHYYFADKSVVSACRNCLETEQVKIFMYEGMFIISLFDDEGFVERYLEGKYYLEAASELYPAHYVLTSVPMYALEGYYRSVNFDFSGYIFNETATKETKNLTEMQQAEQVCELFRLKLAGDVFVDLKSGKEYKIMKGKMLIAN